MLNAAPNRTSGDRVATREGFLFHPREIAFCGYSGSGKTTLITRLIEELTPRFSIGYVKHDAHRFTIDVPGKDTFRARHSGAETVFINDSSQWAVVSNGAPPLDGLRAIYAPLDLVFVEGLKESSLRKVVVLDADDAILEAVNLGAVSSIALFVGSRSRHPSLSATYFQRDEVASITRHVLMVLGLEAAQDTEPRDWRRRAAQEQGTRRAASAEARRLGSPRLLRPVITARAHRS